MIIRINWSKISHSDPFYFHSNIREKNTLTPNIQPRRSIGIVGTPEGTCIALVASSFEVKAVRIARVAHVAIAAQHLIVPNHVPDPLIFWVIAKGIRRIPAIDVEQVLIRRHSRVSDFEVATEEPAQIRGVIVTPVVGLWIAPDTQWTELHVVAQAHTLRGCTRGLLR